MSKKIDNIVVDTSAFIKNASLQDLAENIYTIQNVVDEVTSKAQLRRLVVLPYQLKIKDPFPENIKFVSEFAKKTGDYTSLSATDIQVLALTYELEKQLVGNEHLKTEPTIKRTNTVGTPEETKQIAGFYMPGKKTNGIEEEEEDDDKVNEELRGVNVEELEASDDEYTDSEECEDDDDDDDNNDIGWITPENLAQVKIAMRGTEDITEKPPTVACVTSDFAMQNVLRQIGLQVVSADGKLIRDVRTYILRCYGCYKTTSVMTKVFCPKCGNRTLKKVAVTLNGDGSLQLHFSRKPLSCKGKQQSLPMPKAGKHANNDIRYEDQRIPQQRATRLARIKNNPLDPDYLAGASPFTTRDTTSRAAMLGINSNWANRGPNHSIAPKKRTHRRK